jgi:Tfp pilus assembly protein PilO
MTSKLAQNRSWVVTIALAGGALAYAYFVFLPYQREIGLLKDQLRAAHDYIVQSDSVRQSIAEAEDELRLTREFAKAWRRSAPHASQWAPSLGAISQAAKESHTATVRFEPQTPFRLEAIHRVSILLGSRGEFAQLQDLLGRVESLPQSVWIEELRLARPAENSPILSCELNLALFADNHEDSD